MRSPKEAPKTTDEKPAYAGHRQRLRHRFLEGGADALHDYELLEMMLFLAQPRRDVKPLAKRLMAEFSSFSEVIAAEPATLRKIDGMGEAAIAALKTAEAAALRLLRTDVLGRPILGSWQKLLDYLQASMSRRKTEQFRLLFLDQKNILIADELQQTGTIDHTPLYPREVMKRALELNASALILVHNHPSGDPTPSKADIDMTREVQIIAEKLGVTLHDHVIIGRGSHTSFKTMGLL